MTLPHQRPELYALRPLPETTGYVRPAPDRVLCNRPITDLADLLATCRPAKLALGVTRVHPTGQVQWSWRAAHGFGWRAADGRIAESVRVRFDDPADPYATGSRGAVLLWTRPVPHPALMAACITACDLVDPHPRTWALAAVLRAIPAPAWKLAYSSLFDVGEDGRLSDVPTAISSAVLKTETRAVRS